MKVYQAIVAVAGEMAKEGISKDRENKQQGYNFRGIDDVYNALAPMLAKHGLAILPRMLSRESVERQTMRGGTLFYVTVEAEFDFVSAEDGSKHTVRTYGEAMDSGDKGTNKAMSAAYKYAAFQTFCIPTAGENDADFTTHEVAPQVKPASSSKQANKVQAPKLALDDAKIALGEADSIDLLKSLFGKYWTLAADDQKAPLKAEYDRLKALLEQPA